MRTTPWVLATLTILSLAVPRAHARWQTDGAAVAIAVGDQTFPKTVSDGAGGAIIVWRDDSNFVGDLYAQRVDAAGVAQWAAGGVPVCTHPTSTTNFVDVQPDGAGGVFVVWSDNRTGLYDILAQRVNGAGVVQWAVDGVAICAAANFQYEPVVASDGAGGAIIAWRDDRVGLADIFAQRVNGAGSPLWALDGVPVVSNSGFQNDPAIVADGSGGAIVAWEELQLVSGATYNIFAQRVNAAGVVQWAVDGVPLCQAGNNEYDPRIVADGAGGAIVAWYDYRNSVDADIYAQRVGPSGLVQWTVDGVPLCLATNNQTEHAIVSDGAGGAIVAWQDARSGVDADVYAQRIGASGALRWNQNGVALCAAVGGQGGPTVLSDGAGGAIVAWHDIRNLATHDIYAQRVDAHGLVLWTPNGVALCNAAGDQGWPTIAGDGSSGAIVSWHDARPGATDIYAQRLETTYGYWGHPEPVVVSVADIPDDQGGKVAVNWRASDRDRPVPRTIGHYTVWRMVLSASAPPALTDIREVGPDAIGPLYAAAPAPPGPHFDFFLEFVGAQSAHGWPAYSYSAPTRADSIAGSPNDEIFFVAAHDKDDDYIAFLSNGIAGHSVDNLAPAAPLYLTAQRVGADVQLRWNRPTAPDLRDYAIYRATSPGVAPVPINFLAGAEDTMAVDANAPNAALYYIVTAYDAHENQSGPSNEASVGATTGIGNLAPIAALTVLPNYPNPFAATTALDIGLPAAGAIEIEVYDVAGRRVRELRTAGAKGWQRVTVAGVDERGRPLASGVYFYRVRAGGETVTRKMVIAR